MGEVVKKDEAEQTAAGDRMLGLIRTKFPGYHPLIAIAEIAHHKDSDLRMQLECHKTLIKYVSPELKSVEVKADIKETRRVIVSMFDGETFENGSNTPLDNIPTRAAKPDPLWKGLEFEDVEEVA